MVLQHSEVTLPILLQAGSELGGDVLQAVGGEVKAALRLCVFYLGNI